MTNVFSPRTLGDFEDASASIPLRRLNRAFERAQVVPGDDPAGPEGAGGARRAQFRRYVAGVDLQDPQHVNRLGAALGALIAEVATSKKEYLVKAAERDGFVFVDGIFRAAAAITSFAITDVADLARIDELGRRLYVLAGDRPADAVAGADELIDSVFRAVRAGRKSSAGSAGNHLHAAGSTLESRERLSPIADEPTGADALATSCLDQLRAAAVRLSDMRTMNILPRHARLAVAVAVAVAGYVADAYAQSGPAATGGVLRQHRIAPDGRGRQPP